MYLKITNKRKNTKNKTRKIGGYIFKNNNSRSKSRSNSRSRSNSKSNSRSKYFQKLAKKQYYNYKNSYY